MLGFAKGDFAFFLAVATLSIVFFKLVVVVRGMALFDVRSRSYCWIAAWATSTTFCLWALRTLACSRVYWPAEMAFSIQGARSVLGIRRSGTFSSGSILEGKSLNEFFSVDEVSLCLAGHDVDTLRFLDIEPVFRHWTSSWVQR